MKHNLNQLIKAEMHTDFPEIFHRLETLDLLCEFGVGGHIMLQRWLFANLSEIEKIIHKKRENKAKLNRLKERVDYTKKGVEKFIVGRGRA